MRPRAGSCKRRMDARGAGGGIERSGRKGRMTAACSYHSIGLLTAPEQTEDPMIGDREPFDGRSAGGNNAVATRNPPQLQSNEGTGGSQFHERELVLSRQPRQHRRTCVACHPRREGGEIGGR
jgi:hypothetical protein